MSLAMKEQLIQEIRHTPEDTILVTVETFDTGEYNETEFRCTQDVLMQVIHNSFDDNLHGSLPNGFPTTIKGWNFYTEEQLLTK